MIDPNSNQTDYVVSSTLYFLLPLLVLVVVVVVVVVTAVTAVESNMTINNNFSP